MLDRRDMDTLLQDLRYGLRMFARSPGFTAVAVLTLAVGIGATTAIFSFVNAVLLRPLPYPGSDRLVLVSAVHPKVPMMGAVTPGDFVDWQAQNRVFEGMAAYMGQTLSLTGAGEPERIYGATVTTGFFRTLGVSAIAGRTFDPARDRTSDAVVIGERLWRRRFGSDRDVVGRAITLDGNLFTIVGIMPDDFTFPNDGLGGPDARAFPPIEVWTILRPEPGYRNNAMLRVVARLPPGTTLAHAQAHMTTIAAGIGDGLRSDQRVGVRIESLHEQMVSDVRLLLYVFLGAVTIVLLIACVNVANLLLARATARAREVAVRAALGSTRRRLVRQFLTESILLGLMGGAGGMLVAAWGVDLALAIMPEGALPRLRETGFDAQALSFSIAASIVSAVLFGLAPALSAFGRDIVSALKDSGHGHAQRAPILDVLVVAEVTLAFVLATGAGLMVRSFLRLTSVDPGFRPERILTLSVTLPERSYEDSAGMRSFAAAVVERLRTTPGVTYAGAVNWLPFGGQMLGGTFIVEGIEGSPGVMASKPAVTSDYFRAMGIPLVRGRAFTDADVENAPGVAIVTAQMARLLWPGQDALGKRLKIGFGKPEEQPWLSVVGVVGDVRTMGLDEEAQPAIYVPTHQAPRPFLLRSTTFVLRTGVDPANVAAAARSEIRKIDPNLPVDRVATMEGLVATSVSEPRFRSVVLSAFAAAGLVLVATGIVGVLAYTVSRRTREIGVRVALGAQRRDVLSLVLRHALVMTSAGIAAGLIASVALTRVLRRFLYGVEPTDPLSFVAASILLIAVALAAVYVPARRALRVDPLVALRVE